MCVCAFEWLPRPAVSPLPTTTASHSDLQMSRLCAVSPELDGLDKKSTPNKNGVLTLREQYKPEGGGVRERQGRRRRCRRCGAGPEIGVRTNRLNFAESKGKYTTRIVTEVTRVTSPPLPLSPPTHSPLIPLPERLQRQTQTFCRDKVETNRALGNSSRFAPVAQAVAPSLCPSLPPPPLLSC